MDDASARALHRNAAARAVIRSPALAAVHSRAFVAYSNNSVEARSTISPYTPLWGQNESEISPPDTQVLPEWFRIHDALCVMCMVPLVPGLTSRLGRRQRTQAQICTLCGYAQPQAVLNRPKFPSVRARKRSKSGTVKSQVATDRPVDAVAAAEARIAAEAKVEKPKAQDSIDRAKPKAGTRKANSGSKVLGSSARSTADAKAGLRELLAQKKDKPTTHSGGLADFLSKL